MNNIQECQDADLDGVAVVHYSLADLIMFDAGCTAVDYAFLRRMTMSARIPNSFELIVRSFLQNAIFAGPFEAKLSRCALCWPVLGPVCIAIACSTMFSINAVVQCLTSLKCSTARFLSVGICNEITLFVLPSSWHMRCSGSASAMPLLKTWHVEILGTCLCAECYAWPTTV